MSKFSDKLDYLLDTTDLTYIVYMLIFPSGKQYVGVTSQAPDDRWLMGEGYTNNPEMYAEITSVGWSNVEKKIIKSDLTKCEAEQLETKIMLENDLLGEGGYNRKVSFTPTITRGQYQNAYKRDHYDTIRIDLPKGTKDFLKSEAAKRNISVTQMMINAIDLYLREVTI